MDHLPPEPNDLILSWSRPLTTKDQVAMAANLIDLARKRVRTLHTVIGLTAFLGLVAVGESIDAPEAIRSTTNVVGEIGVALLTGVVIGALFALAANTYEQRRFYLATAGTLLEQAGLPNLAPIFGVYQLTDSHLGTRNYKTVVAVLRQRAEQLAAEETA